MSATATLDNPTMDPSAINEDGFTTPMVAWERFDASAQRYLGIGGSEFQARLDEGRLDVVDADIADVAIVYAVMPLEHRKAA